MVELLHRYFLIHKTLGIPGIGNFYFQRQKATFDFSRRIFMPPYYSIAFKETAAAGDKHLYDFISKQQHAGYVDVIEQFNHFTAALKKELTDNKLVELSGIGVLTESSAGQINFHPASLSTIYFPDIVAERVARDTKPSFDVPKKDAFSEKKEVLVVEKPEEKRVKGIPEDERWWLFALILALIAMAAIFYYYYTNGSLT